MNRKARPIVRLFASAVALAAWFALLFLGHPLKGSAHLLLAVAILLVPRRPAEVREAARPAGAGDAND